MNSRVSCAREPLSVKVRTLERRVVCYFWACLPCLSSSKAYVSVLIWDWKYFYHWGVLGEARTVLQTESSLSGDVCKQNFRISFHSNISARVNWGRGGGFRVLSNKNICCKSVKVNVNLPLERTVNHYHTIRNDNEWFVLLGDVKSYKI